MTSDILKAKLQWFGQQKTAIVLTISEVSVDLSLFINTGFFEVGNNHLPLTILATCRSSKGSYSMWSAGWRSVSMICLDSILRSIIKIKMKCGPVRHLRRPADFNELHFGENILSFVITSDKEIVSVQQLQRLRYYDFDYSMRYFRREIILTYLSPDIFISVCQLAQEYLWVLFFNITIFIYTLSMLVLLSFFFSFWPQLVGSM
jgi:hypothetical protein